MEERIAGSKNPIVNSHHFPTCIDDTEFKCARNTGSLVTHTATNTHDKIALDTTPSSLIYESTTSNVNIPVCVENSIRDTIIAIVPKINAERRGVQLNLSWNAHATTCTRDIREVIPARTREAKNITPNMTPPGICEIICGKVTNDKPIPEIPCSLLILTP